MSAHTLAIRKSRAAPNLHDFLDVLGGELPLHLQLRIMDVFILPAARTSRDTCQQVARNVTSETVSSAAHIHGDSTSTSSR